MAGSDDLFGDDPEAERAAEEYERLQRVLLDAIEEVMEAENLDDPEMVGLLVDAAVRLRTAAYGMQVEKPSVAGFRLDLDRFRQEVDHLIREAKKHADEFIALAKEARAQQQNEPDTE